MVFIIRDSPRSNDDTPSVTVGVIHSALAWRPLLHRATSNTFLNKYFRLIVCMEKNQYRNRTWLSVNKIKQNTARHKKPDGHDHVVMNEYPPRHVFYLYCCCLDAKSRKNKKRDACLISASRQRRASTRGRSWPSKLAGPGKHTEEEVEYPQSPDGSACRRTQLVK